MMRAGKIRLGVIGIGFGQHVHVPAFRADPRCSIERICATTEARARHVAGKLGVPGSCGDWREMTSDTSLDALSIALPPSLQPMVIEAAAAAGKHVFCEKPVASSLVAARSALAAAEAARIHHVVDFLFTRAVPFEKAKQLLDAGSLGRIRHAALSWKVETYAYRTKSDSWKTRAAEGGGTLLNFASHVAHDVEWLLGRIERVSARLVPARETDAVVEAWLEMEDSFPVSLTIAANAFLGSGYRLEIYGEEGTLVLENRGADHVAGFTLLHGTRKDGSLQPISLPTPVAGEDGRVRPASALASALLDAIESGQRPKAPDLRDGVRAQEILGSIRLAHESGSWQPT